MGNCFGDTTSKSFEKNIFICIVEKKFDLKKKERKKNF